MTSEKLKISQKAEEGNVLWVENVTVVSDMEKIFVNMIEVAVQVCRTSWDEKH
jgi:hypothetical protein